MTQVFSEPKKSEDTPCYIHPLYPHIVFHGHRMTEGRYANKVENDICRELTILFHIMVNTKDNIAIQVSNKIAESIVGHSRNIAPTFARLVEKGFIHRSNYYSKDAKIAKECAITAKGLAFLRESLMVIVQDRDIDLGSGKPIHIVAEPFHYAQLHPEKFGISWECAARSAHLAQSAQDTYKMQPNGRLSNPLQNISKKLRKYGFVNPDGKAYLHDISCCALKFYAHLATEFGIQDATSLHKFAEVRDEYFEEYPIVDDVDQNKKIQKLFVNAVLFGSSVMPYCGPPGKTDFFVAFESLGGTVDMLKKLRTEYAWLIAAVKQINTQIYNDCQPGNHKTRRFYQVLQTGNLVNMSGQAKDLSGENIPTPSQLASHVFLGAEAKFMSVLRDRIRKHGNHDILQIYDAVITTETILADDIEAAQLKTGLNFTMHQEMIWTGKSWQKFKMEHFPEDVIVAVPVQRAPFVPPVCECKIIDLTNVIVQQSSIMIDVHPLGTKITEVANSIKMTMDDALVELAKASTTVFCHESQEVIDVMTAALSHKAPTTKIAHKFSYKSNVPAFPAYIIDMVQNYAQNNTILMPLRAIEESPPELYQLKSKEMPQHMSKPELYHWEPDGYDEHQEAQLMCL